MRSNWVQCCLQIGFKGLLGGGGCLDDNLGIFLIFCSVEDENSSYIWVSGTIKDVKLEMFLVSSITGLLSQIFALRFFNWNILLWLCSVVGTTNNLHEVLASYVIQQLF